MEKAAGLRPKRPALQMVVTAGRAWWLKSRVEPGHFTNRTALSSSGYTSCNFPARTLIRWAYHNGIVVQEHFGLRLFNRLLLGTGQNLEPVVELHHGRA